MNRLYFTGGLVLAAFLVFAGITEAGGWMHGTDEGRTRKSEYLEPATLRVESLPAIEEGEAVAAPGTGTHASSKSNRLEVENLPAFGEGESWGPVETGTIKSGGSARHGMNNPAVLEGGKYGGD